MFTLFENFQLWKLHSAADYINLALFLIFFVTVGGIVVRQYKRQRNDAAAALRVCRKLKRLAAQKALVCSNARVVFEADTVEADVLFAGEKTVCLIYCIGWGTLIKGGSEEGEWRLIHGNECRKIPNPLRRIQQKSDALQAAMEREGHRINVYPLVVFADNFSRPVVCVDQAARESVTTYHQLKSWYRQHIKESGEEVDAAPFLRERLVTVPKPIQTGRQASALLLKRDRQAFFCDAKRGGVFVRHKK